MADEIDGLSESLEKLEQTIDNSGRLMEQAAKKIRLYRAAFEEIAWECDGKEDIDGNGNPNLAMRIASIIKELGI